jgi:hypothetical protein
MKKHEPSKSHSAKLKGFQKFTKGAVHATVHVVKHGAEVVKHGAAVGAVATAKVGLNVTDLALHKLSDFVEHNPELWTTVDREVDAKKIHPTQKDLLKKGLRVAHEQIQNGNFADFMARAHAYVAKKEADLQAKQPSKEGLKVMGQATKVPPGEYKVPFTLPKQGFGRTA